MPSRRRTRRAPRPANNFSRRRAARPRKKLKSSHKPRLVRRYIRRKQEEAKPHPKHTDSSNLRVSGKNSNAVKAAAHGSHNAVAADSKSSSRKAQVEEVTAVPNPTPDSGMAVAPGALQGAGSPLLGGLAESTPLLVSTIPLSLAALTTRPLSFSALPPLSSLVVSGTATMTGLSRIYGSSSSVLAIPTNPPNTPVDAAEAPKAHSVNVAVVVLLAVGSALLLLGACITIRMCTRPRRGKLPVPSLPILRDGEPDEDFFDTKESPLFGGKERFSPMPGVGGHAWNWVQYSQNTNQDQATGQNLEVPREAHRPSAGHQEPNAPQEVTSETTSNNAANRPALPPSATLQSVRRQSLASLYSPRSYGHIGQAITQDRKNKSSAKRRSQLGSEDKQRRRESAMSCGGLAYDGDEAASPSPVEYMHPEKTPVLGNNYEGRERIKSGYFAAGTYPRISTLPSTSYSIATATRINVGGQNRNSFVKDKYTIPSSVSKRQRDTQALTYALGLATPETKYALQSSPQPSLYPDDSISIADTKRAKKRNPSDRKAVDSAPDVPVIVPTSKGSRNSGLMGMDFGVSQMSLSALTKEPLADDETADERKNGHHEPPPLSFRNTDKPPRVPSPPPMPSLAQMALQQHNPEAYANYRSPTYSLYGLYESADRKSFAR